MIKILQINIDRGRGTHDLTIASATTLQTDLLLIGECNLKKSKASG